MDEFVFVALPERPAAGGWLELEVDARSCFVPFLRVFWAGACPWCGANAFIGHVPGRLDLIGPDFELVPGDQVMAAELVPSVGARPVDVAAQLPIAVLQGEVAGELELIEPWTRSRRRGLRERWQCVAPYSFHIAGDCNFTDRFHEARFLDFCAELRPGRSRPRWRPN